MTSLWAAFLYRDYRFLWLTLMAGSIIVWMRILGAAQWLLDETGSAWLVGMIGVVQLVVQIPTTLWAGTLADRVDRKRLMFVSHGISAITLLALGVLNHLSLATPMLIYGVVGITAGTHMLSSPARSALIPIIVRKEELMTAVSTDTASANVAAIVGPLIFALVAVAFDLTAVFLLAGGIALIASLAPLLIKATGRVTEDKVTEDDAAPQKPSQKLSQKPSQLRQTIDGLQYVSRHPILPGLFLLDVGITTASFYREILPVLALGLFAGGASATGMLGAANSTGAIVGSFVALMLATYRAKGMLVLYASFVYGAILFLFGTASSLWLGLLAITLLGAADAVTVAVRQTTVMLTTPDAMRGRAFALMILAAQTANNTGTIWVGFWAGAVGAGNTMLMGGVISIAATALIWLFWRPIREFRSD